MEVIPQTKISIKKNTILVGEADIVDFHEGSNVTLDVVKNSEDEIDVTINATDTVGVPGNTTVTEQTFGQASSAGTSTDYSRKDHTHGTPNAPVETDPVFVASEASSFVAGDKAKLDGIEVGAEVNNISDVNATDLTDSGATILHKHDHGGMDGLTDDDHTGYAMLAGRSGGQILYFGTDSGNFGRIFSTSHATKGVNNLGNILYIDEVNNRVGILKLDPGHAFHANIGTERFVVEVTNDGAVQSPFVLWNDGTAIATTGSGVLFSAGAAYNNYIGGLCASRIDANNANLIFRVLQNGSLSPASTSGPFYISGGNPSRIYANVLFFPQQAPTASAPSYVKGAIYFDTTLNKLRVGGATAWETITSA